LMDADAQEIKGLDKKNRASYQRMVEMVQHVEDTAAEHGLAPRIQDAVAEILTQHLNKYSTTLEQDEEELQHVEPFSRKKHALVTRASEKQMIHHWIEEYSNGALQDALANIAQ
jgi:hypothetical protein